MNTKMLHWSTNMIEIRLKRSEVHKDYMLSALLYFQSSCSSCSSSSAIYNQFL